jgi:hypothetical protein
LIDDVDEKRLIAIEPRAFSMPGESVRRARFEDFLSQYRAKDSASGD